MIRPCPGALSTFLRSDPSALAAGVSTPPSLSRLVLAQIPHMTRGPGLYLNLFKFVPVVLIYLLWAWTTDWVEHDTKDLNNLKFGIWNSVIFFSGVLGLVLVLAIPIYFLGLGLLLLAYFIPLLTYVYVRNQTVPDDQKVLTPYHFGEVANDLHVQAGDEAAVQPRRRHGRSGGPADHVRRQDARARPRKIRRGCSQAEESRSFMAAKELVYDAVLRRATDIHLEPTTEQLSVRYRIDGILHAAEPFDRPTGDAVVNVFKVLSAMDISEKRKPQDGSFGAKLSGRDLDFRVATSGSKAGEKLVMRILDNSSAVTKLEDLGMRPKLIESGPRPGDPAARHVPLLRADRGRQVDHALRRPSARSTATRRTSSPSKTRSSTTSTTSPRWRSTPRPARRSPPCLRSILRQDPDVIMIGEIRDHETASIACQAANTGHMVFSTVHSNDAVTALFRLLDLGVEPFMIASALSGVLGQRLVRILCEACKEPYKPKPEFLKKANLPGRQGRRLLPASREPRAGLPAVRRDRLLRPDRDLRAAGAHRSR